MNLKEKGFTTFKVYDEDRLSGLRSEFLYECKTFQEFSNVESNQFVLGGFSAFGNPSSFHNLFVRKVRSDVYIQVFQLFQEIFPNKNIEMLFDRMMLRKKGVSPSRETWHRDITPDQHTEDVFFGGWLNLDDNDQYFSCIPETQTDSENKNGFVKIKKNTEDYTKVNKKKENISILPGHCVIFYQNILHEVVATKAKVDMYRVFNSFRVTTAKHSIYDYTDVFSKQSVPFLPSKQVPPMYAKLHWSNHIKKLEEFSKTINPICLEKCIMKSTNIEYTIVQRFMKSLAEYNLKLYPDYSSEEKKLFSPQILI